jgi:hypothetical protein
VSAPRVTGERRVRRISPRRREARAQTELRRMMRAVEGTSHQLAALDDEFDALMAERAAGSRHPSSRTYERRPPSSPIS